MLPSMQIIFFIVLVHVVVIALLAFVWIYIRHAQRAHKKEMEHSKFQDMPSKVDEIKDTKLRVSSAKIREAAIETSAQKKGSKHNLANEMDQSLDSKKDSIKELPSTVEKVNSKYHKEYLDKKIKELSGKSAPSFNHKSRITELDHDEILKNLQEDASLAKEKINKNRRLQEIDFLSEEAGDFDIEDFKKSAQQKEFEEHFTKVKSFIRRKKNQNDPVMDNYSERLSQIDAMLKDLRERNMDISREDLSKALASEEPDHLMHEKWQEKVAKDFENLFIITSKEAKKHKSWFGKKRENFVAMHKEEAEQKALDLVRDIVRRIEGDHPIPPQELDWIEASLHDVERDIWQAKHPGEKPID